MDASEGFTGSSLTFGVTGEGVAIDPETGLLTIQTDSLREGITVTVTATNSGGTATSRFTLTVTADDEAPEAEAPALVEAPVLVGTGRIGTTVGVEPGVWSGTPVPDLAFRWLIDGTEIAGADAAEYLPGAAEDGRALACRVTAANAGGSAEAVTAPVVVTYAPPVAAEPLPDLKLTAGSGPQTVEAAAAFAGENLVYSVEGAGATIDATTGTISIPIDAPIAGATVTVTAANSGGSATATFGVTVEAAKAPAGPAEIGPENAELLVTEGPKGEWYITMRMTDPAHPLSGQQGGLGQLRWTHPGHADGGPPSRSNTADKHPQFGDADSPFFGCWWCRLNANGSEKGWADKRNSGVGAVYEMRFAWLPDPAAVPLEAQWVEWGAPFDGENALVIYDPTKALPSDPPPAPQAGDWDIEQITVQA